MNKVAMPYGLRGTDLVYINEVQSGYQEDVVCPSCKSPLIAKKGPRQSWHFAHPSDAPCAGSRGESALHETAKLLVLERLMHGIKPSIAWNCPVCSGAHRGTPWAGSTTFSVEKSFGVCRPDIVGLDEQGKPLVIIEIVVTHSPEQNVYDFAETAGARLIEITIDSFTAAEALPGAAIWKATKVNRCLAPSCDSCSGPTTFREMTVHQQRCSCGSVKRIPVLSSSGRSIPLSEFSNDDVAAACGAGATLEMFRDQLVAVCKRCKQWATALNGSPVDFSRRVSIGYRCPACTGEPYQQVHARPFYEQQEALRVRMRERQEAEARREERRALMKRKLAEQAARRLAAGGSDTLNHTTSESEVRDH